MIAFLDVNTIWRRKFAEALARRSPYLMPVAPYAVTAPSPAAAGDRAVALPPGWAGRLSGVAMPLLQHRILQAARARGRPLAAVILTTPHYRLLLRTLPVEVATVYYASDDYRSYAGWDAGRMARDEAAICRRSAVSIFVSEALRSRAVAEYGLDPDRTLVSPNATEARFAAPPAPPAAIATLPRPIFGTAGMLNARIDLDYLHAVAADARVGSLALIGPVDDALARTAAFGRLRAAAKVHVFGEQPHDEMHAWMSGFDVAIIPYAATTFNRLCSPMRLYDHRAIGHPIIATRHCAQVAESADVLSGDIADVAGLIEAALAAPPGRHPRIETWDDRVDALSKRAVAGFLFRQ